MAGVAAGGFVIRAFESMLKECSNKKYSALQTAIKTYLDTVKELNQQTQGEESKQTSPAASDQSVSSGSHVGSERVHPGSDNSIGGPDAELVLKPLRFAFETKHMKIMELALDCLHKLIEYNHLEGDPGLDDGKNAQLLMEILNMVCSSVDSSSPDSTTLQVLKVLLTAVASTKMRVHGEPLLEIIRVCYIIALNSKSPISQATSKAMLVQMLSIIFGRMEADVVSTSSEIKEDLEGGSESDSMFLDILSVDQSNDPSFASEEIRGSTDIKELEAVLIKGVEREEVGDMIRGMDTESATVNQRDALLVFRTLCKMGMKEDNNETTVKTRVLSLELLQGVLEGVGNSFMKSFYTVKAHLSFVVLRASVSQSPAILQYAAGIFSVILQRFRVPLKAEVGMLFPIIFLRPLDGSDLNQKLSVLRMLEKVFKDPHTLIDLYLNYDCDLEAPNLFEKMVVTLSKIYQGTPDADPKSSTALQTGSVKLSSLQGLVDVLKSLVVWEKFHTGLKLHNKKTESTELENAPGELHESKSEEDPSISSDKSTVEVVVSKFNQHPGKGIQHLISIQLVEKTPASVAQFLLNTSNLDKTMIGYYLGQREEFPRYVMHAYVESMDFSGMRFDVAIREFLKGFRLPQDAQKVDFILEKFAERYCADNPALFKHADTAYVLAYAAIMLSTDAHNSTVQPRLGKSDFIRIVTMNNFAETTPQELLEEIYDSIAKEAIVVEDDHVKSFENIKRSRDVEKSGLIDFLNLSFPKSNSSSDSKSEKEPIIKKIQALIKDQGGKKAGVFYTSHKVEILHPMVEVVGWPLLATFSVTMGELEHKPRISLCMEGFKEGIHLTHVLGMDTMRYAFLTSLLRYNYLHAPKDMREKNTEALRALLDLCDTDVHALQHSWFAILECISRLEYAVSSPAMIATIMQGSNQISRDVVLQALRELSGKPTEQVFTNTIKLPSESVVEFFSALCSVSAEELKQTPARLFSLQKVVEISYYNMTRIHMVWARIWSIVSQHLIFAGSHPDEKVAKYAVESLGQLGQKYLDHAELANFTFQNYIVKPFAVLMRNGLSSSMRMLLAECIVQIIKSKAGNIKSGWRSIFMVFSAAAEDDVETIVESAFENVEQVILEHFNLIVDDCFMDCVHCLIGFASNRSSPAVSLKAIALLRICENRLSESIISLAAQKSIDDKLGKTCDFAEQYWFPMLDGLSNLVSDPRPEVRNCALEVLFDLLNERGNKFPSQFWEKIFHQVLFPIFDHLRHAGKESDVSSGDEWLRESSIHSLQLLCNLFNTFYKDVCFMLPQLLSLLLDCAKKTDQSVVSLSLGALTHLIEIGGHQFIDQDWDTLLKSIREASFSTQPLELLNDLGFENRKQHKVLALDSGSSTPMAGNKNHHTFPENGNTVDHNHERLHTGNAEGSEDLTSPSGRAARLSNDGGLQHSQSFGQKIMGNMNFFSRSFSSKPKSVTSDAMVPSSPSKLPGPITELSTSDDEESPIMESIRSKCMTQLLLLGAIDIIQKKYWNNLNAQQKVTIMEILFSVLEFAASYNSYTNLRLRMLQSSTERPPLNLLRQELFATCIYLNILQKTTAGSVLEDELTKEDKLERIAEEKLVNFCEHTLKEASDFQSTIEEATNMNIHRVLELRSPLIVQMLKSMCQMNPKIFKIHLRKFYPSMTKLINCEQMDIRGALADLLGMQLKILVTDESS